MMKPLAIVLSVVKICRLNGDHIPKLIRRRTFFENRSPNALGINEGIRIRRMNSVNFFAMIETQLERLHLRPANFAPPNHIVHISFGDFGSGEF